MTQPRSPRRLRRPASAGSAFAPASLASASLSLAFLALVLAGCRFKGEPDRGPTATPSSDPPDQGWVARPVSMRIYPTTRFVREARATLLDARVELRDEMGDPVKASGDYRFELYLVSGPGGLASARPIYIWERAVRAIEDHRLHYDGITSTYGFRLGASDPRSALQSTKLVVTFTPLMGPRQVAEAILGTELLIERSQSPTQ